MFLCPNCGQLLEKEEKTYHCPNGHSFDIAKSGYVNLLPPTGQGHHGDDKRMVRARTAFLNEGYYEPLANTITDMLAQHLKEGNFVVDAGCGEGYYTDRLQKKLFSCTFIGIDISKDALMVAGKRNRVIHYAVGSTAKMPLQDSTADAVLNIFSPLFLDEFSRVLKRGGFLLRVIPLEKHLYELKKEVYDKPYENDVLEEHLTDFELIESKKLEYGIDLDNNDSICNLFSMTPYYYKTGKKDQEKLLAIQQLYVSAAFQVMLYQKN